MKRADNRKVIYSKYIPIRIEPSLLERVEQYGKRQGFKRSEAVRRLIKKALNEENEKRE